MRNGLIFLICAMLFGCASDGEKICEPGEMYACFCGTKDREGVQMCSSDGTYYSACACYWGDKDAGDGGDSDPIIGAMKPQETMQIAMLTKNQNGE